MARRAQLSPDVLHFFETGFDLSPDMLRVLPDEREALWHRYDADFLDDWIIDHPGSRPAAWWEFDATEPRRVLHGAELGLPGGCAWVWRGGFNGGRGVPAMRQIRPPGYIELSLVESTPAYLTRLGLLTHEEHAALDPEDFEPVTIDPFVIDETTRDQPERPLYDPDAQAWCRAQYPRWQREWAASVAERLGLASQQITNKEKSNGSRDETH